MADIEYVREHADGYTHQGHSASARDKYIKLRRSFRQHSLKLLKGAPLSIFLCVALSDTPPNVQDISDDTGYHPETVCIALDFLCERRFLAEISRHGSHGNKRYIPLAYTWSGPDDNAPDADDSQIRKNRIRQMPPRKNRAGHAEIPRSNSGFPLSNSENPRENAENSVHDDDDESDNSNSSREHHHGAPASASAIEKILAKGFDGINARRLVAHVQTVESAEMLVAWLDLPETRKRFRNPQGFAYTEITKNPRNNPFWLISSPSKPEKPPVISGKLANLFGNNDETS